MGRGASDQGARQRFRDDLSTVLKRYPCHATAHPAVKAVQRLQAAAWLRRRARSTSITVTGTRRMAERHNILEPPDLMLAQYSIPFCVALALFPRGARPRKLYDDGALADPAIRALCRKVYARRRRTRRDAHGAAGEPCHRVRSRMAAASSGTKPAACSIPAELARQVRPPHPQGDGRRRQRGHGSSSG